MTVLDLSAPGLVTLGTVTAAATALLWVLFRTPKGPRIVKIFQLHPDAQRKLMPSFLIQPDHEPSQEELLKKLNHVLDTLDELKVEPKVK